MWEWGEFDKSGGLCTVEKCILPMYLSCALMRATVISYEFKPKYVIAVSYQVVFKFAWRYSSYFLTDSPHMWSTCTLNFVFLWNNSVTLNLMLILFLLQYRPFQWVCFPFNFILFSELIGFYHLVHFCWMNCSCTNVKVPLKKSMVKVEVLSFFFFLFGLLSGKERPQKSAKYIRGFFPLLDKHVVVGGVLRCISQPKAIPRKIFKMVTWICVHCPPGGYGVNCYFKE